MNYKCKYGINNDQYLKFKGNENLVYGNKSIDHKRKRVDRTATKLKEIVPFYFIF